MAGNWAPKILLPLPPQHWDWRYVPAHVTFLHGLWGSNLDPHIHETSTLCLKTPLSAPHLTWNGTWGPMSELYLWGFAHARWCPCVSCRETRRGWTPMWSHTSGVLALHTSLCTLHTHWPRAERGIGWETWPALDADGLRLWNSILIPPQIIIYRAC